MDKDKQINKAAQELSKLGASKGGKARANALTPEERSDIARRAVEARWEKTGMLKPKMIRATHEAEIKFGFITIPCAVLEDGTRILRARGIAKALGGRGSGAYYQRKRETKEESAPLPEFVGKKYLEPFIASELKEKLINPITYQTKTGSDAEGLSAILLPEVCNIWLNYREKGTPTKVQLRIAQQAEIIMRGLANVGIIALVDEVTGYQAIRDRLELQDILDRYLRKELAAWAKTFPDEFYIQIFRLKNWQWKGMKVNRPSVVGTYTKDLIYERIEAGLLKELESRNPKNEKGYRHSRHFQWLTQDVGNPALAQHLHAVIGLMRASSNWDSFYRLLQRAFPKKHENLPLIVD